MYSVGSMVAELGRIGKRLRADRPMAYPGAAPSGSGGSRRCLRRPTTGRVRGDRLAPHSGVVRADGVVACSDWRLVGYAVIRVRDDTGRGPPNGLAFSCRERAGRNLQKPTDLAREAVCCNAVFGGSPTLLPT
jgi:hypothetical protein